MIRYLNIFLVIFCFSGSFAWAQSGPPSKPSLAADEIISPAGAKGRFTAEQLQSLALTKVPGELLGVSARRDEKRFFHQYKILAKDQSIYVVEINAVTREINKIYIEQLSANPVLPMSVISLETAKILAIDTIKNKKSGSQKPSVRSALLSVENQNPVYVVKVKKLVTVYIVTVDAVSGKILKVREEK